MKGVLSSRKGDMQEGITNVGICILLSWSNSCTDKDGNWRCG